MASEELAILFQNCVYDEYIQTLTGHDEIEQLTKANSICDQIKAAPNSSRIFKEKKVFLKTYNVDFLLIMSKLKFCIFTMAKFSHEKKHIQATSLFESLNLKLKDLIGNHFQFYENNEVLINYFIKELIRSYGSSSVKFVMANDRLNWITPQTLIGDDNVKLFYLYFSSINKLIILLKTFRV